VKSGNGRVCEGVTCTLGQEEGNSLIQVVLAPYYHVLKPGQETTMHVWWHKSFIKKGVPIGG